MDLTQRVLARLMVATAQAEVWSPPITVDGSRVIYRDYLPPWITKAAKNLLSPLGSRAKIAWERSQQRLTTNATSTRREHAGTGASPKKKKENGVAIIIIIISEAPQTVGGLYKSIRWWPNAGRSRRQRPRARPRRKR